MIWNAETRLGMFALVTLIVAGTGLGRLGGLEVAEAAYLTVLTLAVLGNTVYLLNARLKKD